MKKYLIFPFLLFLSLKANAQFTLEQVYSVPFGKQFSVINLGNNNYKYFLLDLYGSKFSLYNLDHSPFMLNVTTAIPLDSGNRSVAYVTTELFDCDSTNTLLDIAYQRVFDGGEGVLYARAMLGIDMDETGGGGRFAMEETAAGSISSPVTVSHAYPNPAAEEIKFLCKSTGAGLFHVIIYDIAERELINQNAIPVAAEIRVSTAALQNGIYYYKISSGRQVLTQDKFSVIK